jgi:hypothetical protein
MASLPTLVETRLAVCRVQRLMATTKEAADRFLAEEEGLLDALLGRDRMETYSQMQSSIAKSYEIGLYDGQALMRLQVWSDAQHSLSHDREDGSSFHP